MQLIATRLSSHLLGSLRVLSLVLLVYCASNEMWYPRARSVLQTTSAELFSQPNTTVEKETKL